jgi:transposase InsO family protein
VRPQRDYVRFEAAAPNDLWQIDFKGQFGLTAGGKCYPFTAIDDHSRFLVNLTAGPNNQKETVKGDLTTAFRTVVLPETILCDYGAPWGYEPGSLFTQLVAWLISLNVNVIHGRPRHPQTRGKNERIHRNLKKDVLARDAPWNTLDEVQVTFDEWRPIYNYYQPHQGIGTAVPAVRYQPSVRLLPEVIPPPDYPNPEECPQRRAQRESQLERPPHHRRPRLHRTTHLHR